MWQEIVDAFASMQWYIILPLCLGVVLLIAECFFLDFGILGISGLVLIAGGIIANAILVGSIAQTIFLVVLFVVIILILFLLFVRSAKYGILSKTPFIEKETAVPVDFADKDKNILAKLIGQRGVAITDFTPSGKFIIDDKTYDGITRGEALEKNDIIKVIDVDGNRIIIEKVEV